ncbi:MAG TPA: hypothetical protein VNT55_12795, partial [Baekduia sp.]|nr:hypothetical protein [Baekduia sp.]
MDERELQREVFAFTISFEPYVSALVDDIIAHQHVADGAHAEMADPQGLAAARDATAVGVATVLSVIRVPQELPTTLPAASVRVARLSVRRRRTL